MTIMVLTLHFRGPNTKRSPKWVRYLIIERLGQAMCYKRDFKRNIQRRPVCKQNSPYSKKSLLGKTLDIATIKLLNSFNIEELKSTKLRVMIMKEIFSCQSNLISHSEESKCQSSSKKMDMIMDEWKIIAVIIDRLCFMLYFFAFVSTVALYVLFNDEKN